jgi:transposase
MSSPRFKETKRREGTKLLKWERAKRYFLADGYTESTASTSRFLKFVKGNERCVFVGKNGAIRIGKNVSESMDMAHIYWTMIQNWETLTGKGECA